MAARGLLAEVGYGQLTMDAAAARAGTAKAAIYRRYKSKAELMFAAAGHRPEVDVPADTGSVGGDLLALARRVRSDMATPAAREVAPQIIAEVGRSPDVSRRLAGVFVAGERQEIEAILDRAVRRGEPSGMPDVAAVHRLLGGALFFSIMVVNEAIDDADLELVVEILSAGLRSVTGPHAD